MPYCSICGAELVANSKFCVSCGASITILAIGDDDHTPGDSAKKPTTHNIGAGLLGLTSGLVGIGFGIYQLLAILLDWRILKNWVQWLVWGLIGLSLIISLIIRPKSCT